MKATWQIMESEIPGKPFAVVSTPGDYIAGCHATREAAAIQMQTLLVGGDQPADLAAMDAAAAKTPVAAAEVAPAQREEPSVSFSFSRTVMW